MQSSSTGVLSSANVFDVWWSSNHNICVATNGSGGGWSADSSGSNTARGTGYSKLDTTTRPYITNANALANCYNGATNYGSISANQATYLGTIYTSGAGQVSWTLGGLASGGAAGLLGVWNYYNRVTVATNVSDSGTSYTYGSATIRQARNSTGNQVQAVFGLQEDGTSVSYCQQLGITSAGGQFGFGVDSTTTYAQTPVFFNTTGSNLQTCAGGFTNLGAGFHMVSGNENVPGATNATYDTNGLAILSFQARM
jgi:hypothetical protein